MYALFSILITRKRLPFKIFERNQRHTQSCSEMEIAVAVVVEPRRLLDFTICPWHAAILLLPVKNHAATCPPPLSLLLFPLCSARSVSLRSFASPGLFAMAVDGSECHAAQVVGADGEMDGAAMERFAAAAGLTSRGLSYAVVSIFGPQGSGE